MATSKFGVGPTKGSKGDTTFYERNGQVIARQRYAKRGKTRRTPASMSHKTLWINVVHSWTAFGGGLKGNFETKAGQTDYNVFTKLNMLDARVFLSREESERRACVADRFAVSFGALRPAIGVEMAGEWLVSDLELGEFAPSASTAVSELAAALIENSRGRLRWGDELRFYQTENQWTGAENEVPSFGVETCVLPLRPMDGRRLEEVSPRRIWELGGWMARGGRLAALRRRDSLAAWVLRRPDGRGGWQCTCQSLAGSNGLWERYATEAARERAIHSYGPLRDDSMDPRGLPPIVDPAKEAPAEGRRPAKRRELTPAQRLVLGAMEENPLLSAAQLAERIGLSEATVEELLRSIMTDGE